jgi:hypothetical protein
MVSDCFAAGIRAGFRSHHRDLAVFKLIQNGGFFERKIIRMDCYCSSWFQPWMSESLSHFSAYHPCNLWYVPTRRKKKSSTIDLFGLLGWSWLICFMVRSWIINPNRTGMVHILSPTEQLFHTPMVQDHERAYAAQNWCFSDCLLKVVLGPFHQNATLCLTP